MEFIIPNSLDLAIAAAYVAVFAVKRDKRVLLSFLPFIACMFTYQAARSYYDDIFAFSLYSGLYITLSYYLVKRKDFILFIPIITMASYDLLFAVDSWLNSDVETWIWRNHEIIICVLHAFIMLVFSKKFTSMVDACLAYVNMLWNDCTSNSARTSNAKRQPSEARHK